MPLQDVVIQVPLGQGLDQKSDPRLLPAGKVTGMVNATFDKLGSIRKRNGYVALPTGSLLANTGLFSGSQASTATGPTLQPVPPMQALATYKRELLGVDCWGDSVWTLSPQAEVWKQQDAAVPCSVKRQSVAESTANFSAVDSVYCNGYIVYTYLADAFNQGGGVVQGGVYVLIVDAQTQSTVLGPVKVADGSLNPRVASTNRWVMVTWVNVPQGSLNGDLYGFCIDCSQSPPQMVLPATKLSDSSHHVAPFYSYDMCGDPLPANITGGIFYVLYDYERGGYPGVFDLALLHVFPGASPVTSYLAATYPLGNSTVIWSMGLDVAFSGTQGNPYNGVNLAVGYSYSDGSSNDKVDTLVWSGERGDPMSLEAYGTLSSYNQSLFGNAFATGIGVRWRPTTGSLPLDAHDYVVCWENAIDTPGPKGNPTLGEDLAQSVAQLCTYYFQQGVNSSLTSGSQRQQFFVGLMSKPFWVADPLVSGSNRCYVWGNTSDTEWVFDVGVHDFTSPKRQWRPVGCSSPRLVGESLLPITGLGMLEDVTTDGSGSWFTCGQLNTAGAGGSGRTGLELVTIDFTPGQRQSAELGDLVYLGGGVPSYYDGINTGECGFAWYPTPYVFGNNVSGSITSGTYQYSCVWEWVDNRGQLHQSAPSIQQSVTLTGTGSLNSVEVWVPNLTLSDRVVAQQSGSGNFVNLAVYRSVANGTILYRLTPEYQTPATTVYPFSASLDYLDTTNDGGVTNGLDTHQVIYTAGGVLAYFNPPSSRLMTSHNQRLWLAGQDDPKTVWYSNAVVPLSPVTFNDAFSFTVDDGGDITAIAGMDDKLVVFKADRIFIVEGNGPTPQGAQNDITPPVPVPSDVGCINPSSVVLTPDGLMFQSSIGIHLLTRSPEVVYVGGPVTDTLQQFPVITSAVVHPTQNQVRFTCMPASYPKAPAAGIQGVTLVYDYLNKAWSTFSIADSVNAVTGSGATSAVVHQGTYKFASVQGFQASGSVGGVFAENTSGLTGSYSDGAYYVPMTVETAWIAANDIQGLQRVKRAHVLGQAYDSCRLQLSYAVDYQPTYYTPVFWDLAAQPNVSRRYHIGNQKCEAVRIKVEDLQPSGSVPATGQGLSLTRVALVGGAKKGPLKLPPGQSA